MLLQVFQVHLGKTVILENRRLTIVYNVLLLATLCLNGYRFIANRDYTRTVPLRVTPALHVTEASMSSMISSMQSEGDSHASCKIGRLGNHSVMSFGIEWHLQPQGCKPLCDVRNVTKLARKTRHRECLFLNELIDIHSSQDIFLATATHHWHLAERRRSIRWLATPWIGKGFIELSWRFSTLEETGWFFTVNSKWGGTTHSGVSGNESSVVSILLDRLYRPWKLIRGKRPNITITEAVYLTQGFKSDPSSLPVHVVKQGIELMVKISCYNDLADVKFRKGALDVSSLRVGSGTPLCIVRFLLNDDTAVRTRGVAIYRQLKGVHIIATEMISLMRFPDISNFLLNIAGFVIILRVPKAIVYVISTRLLGHLSRVYHQVVHERVSVPRICAAWAVRLVQGAATFYTLTSKDACLSLSPAEERAALSATQLEMFAQAALHGNPDLDPEEIHNANLFCLQELLNKGGNNIDDNSTLNLPMFTELCCALDQKVSNESIRMLLDRDHKLCCLESLFMPVHLKEAVQSKSEAHNCYTKTDLELCPQLSGRVPPNAVEGRQMASTAALRTMYDEIKATQTEMQLLHSRLESTLVEFREMRTESRCHAEHLQGEANELHALRQNIKGLRCYAEHLQKEDSSHFKQDDLTKAPLYVKEVSLKFQDLHEFVKQEISNVYNRLDSISESFESKLASLKSSQVKLARDVVRAQIELKTGQHTPPPVVLHAGDIGEQSKQLEDWADTARATKLLTKLSPPLQ